MKRKNVSISLDNQWWSFAKKKKKSLQEEPIKLSNYQRSFPYNKPIFIPYYRFNREKSSNPIPSHEITKRTKFLLYLTLYLLKPNHSIDPIVVISLEVRPLVPPPPWSTEPSNDCKAPGPSAEGQADSSARSPFWSSPSCSETRSWFAPRSGPDPSRAAASSARSGIDSPRTPSSAWPVVRRWTPSSAVSPPGCRHCHGRPTSSPFSCADLQHGTILLSADICRNVGRISN